MWKIYSRTTRRFKVIVDNLFNGEVDHKWCNYDKLSETIEELYQKHKDNMHNEVHVYEIFDLDWEDEGQ